MSFFRPTITSQGIAINILSKHCRKILDSRVISNNHPAVVKLAFNDAMTYNPETGKGGTVMGLRFRSQAIKKYNKKHLNVLNAILNAKNTEADYNLDHLSYSDYLQVNAIVSVKVANGPDMTEFHRIGRQDAVSEDELEGCSEVPQPEDGVSKFRDAFEAKGFDLKDMTALSFVYAFGVYWPRIHKLHSNHAQFTNDYYKYLVDQSQPKVFSLDNILLDDPTTKEYVDLFAEKPKEFKDAFSHAWTKLCTLGNDDKQLNLEIHPIEY